MSAGWQEKARRAESIKTADRTEGAEIERKLDVALTESGVYTAVEAGPHNRITVRMSYQAARRLTERLQGAGDG